MRALDDKPRRVTSPHARTRLPLALLAGIASVATPSCSDDPLPPTIATVGDTPILKAALDRRVAAVKHVQAQGGPGFTRDQFKAFRGHMLQNLVRGEWVRQEAAAQHIRVTDAELEAAMPYHATPSSPTLPSSVRTIMLEQKLIAAATRPVSEDDLRRHYQAHSRRYDVSDVRYLVIVQTKTKRAITRAQRAVERGQRWGVVTRRYSTDELPRNASHWVEILRGDPIVRELGGVPFRAPQGKTLGPVRTKSGWYLFRVVRVSPGRSQPFETIKETVRANLNAQREQQARRQVNRELRRKYQSQTVCRARYLVPACGNADRPAAR